MKWVKSSELKDKGTRKSSSTLFHCLHGLIWIHYHIVVMLGGSHSILPNACMTQLRSSHIVLCYLGN